MNNINTIDKSITYNCNDCGKEMYGDRYRCMACYYQARDEAYYYA
jgi:uncharacterized OB-fold protein